LGYGQATLGPVEYTRCKEVDKERVGIVEVYGVHVLGVRLHAGALTAPEAVIVGAPGASSPGRAEAAHPARIQGAEVGDMAVGALGILLAQHLVEHGALVVIDIGNIARVEGPQLAR